MVPSRTISGAFLTVVKHPVTAKAATRKRYAAHGRCYLDEEKRGQVEFSTERKGFDFDRSEDSIRQYLRSATSLLSKQKI
ncbi:hypothetical protein SUGI_0129360 [Cryptomeria japonica]|nr:hypothetical protein SUGI_0129360 [Cryptomeria japonica]